MPNLRQMILISLAILIALAAAACGAASPRATPTRENIPLPAVAPTLLPHTPTMDGTMDVGGNKLRYQCFGEGTPTAVVEAGGGDTPVTSFTWKDVTQNIQSLTRICVYNRADLRTSQDIAENLHVLLSTVPVPGPYLLVAHSIGGWHARVFAHLYPQEVAGLILVDTTPTFPDAITAYATAYPTFSPDEAPGITQKRMSEADIYATMPPFNGLDMNASNEQVRQAGSLGDLPLIVISKSLGADDFLELPQVAREQYAATRLRLQADLAALSSKGVFMTAHTTNHFISLYEPEIIIDAITQMVQEIRKP
jgi:pimeloyl-ACP methyl ester carboxylesterase